MRHIFLLWLNPLVFFFGQIGSGFGQSLIVADFNNDNKDDIAVGAPMEGEDDMNKVDVGAVYIYYGTRDGVRVCMRACVVQHMLVYFECITLICVFYWSCLAENTFLLN